MSTILILIGLACIVFAAVGLNMFHTDYFRNNTGSLPKPPHISIKCTNFKGKVLPADKNKFSPSCVISRKEGNLELVAARSLHEDFLFYDLNTVQIWQRDEERPDKFYVTYQCLGRLEDNAYYKHDRDKVEVYWSGAETVEKCYSQLILSFSETFYRNKRWSVPILSATALAFALMIIGIILK